MPQLFRVNLVAASPRRVIGVIRGCVLFCPQEILALCVLLNRVKQSAGAVSQKPVDAAERVRSFEQFAMGRSGPIADQQLIFALASPALLASKESQVSGRIQLATSTAFPLPSHPRCQKYFRLTLARN